MPFKRGFIAPPWPHARGDSVRAECLIQRIEKEASRGCGLYYEIYQYRVLEELSGVLANLDAGDAATFQEVTASHGFSLDESALQGAFQAYHETLSEIRREQE
ncbi:hypothetical protein ACPW5J_004336 [Enterobacter hormaechei]